MAEHYLNNNQHQQALQLVSDIRLISPALPRAALISALAALEQGDARKAESYVGYIEDQPTALKIQTRIAQKLKNPAAELAALTDLHELAPDDGDTFVQLLGVLRRLGQMELATQLCHKNQEMFLDDPEVMTVIRGLT